MMSTSETAARLCLQVHRQRPATLWSHNTRKIWGKIRAYLDRQAHCVCERGNSIGGDFRCGCTFIAGHFKASHHACMAHHGWLMAHYLAGASLFSIVRLWGNFMIWPKQRCWVWASQDAAVSITYWRKKTFVRRNWCRKRRVREKGSGKSSGMSLLGDTPIG